MSFECCELRCTFRTSNYGTCSPLSKKNYSLSFGSLIFLLSICPSVSRYTLRLTYLIFRYLCTSTMTSDRQFRCFVSINSPLETRCVGGAFMVIDFYPYQLSSLASRVECDIKYFSHHRCLRYLERLNHKNVFLFPSLTFYGFPFSVGE